MKIRTVIAKVSAGMLAFISVHATAQSIFWIDYDFDSVTMQSGTNDPTPVPTALGVTCGSFAAVGYAGNPRASTQFTWRDNELGGINGDDNFADFTGQLNAAKYFEVTLMPQVEWSLNLDSLTFFINRSPGGSRSYAVRSSMDGFEVNLPAVAYAGNTNLGVGPDNSFQWLYDAFTSPLKNLSCQVDLGTNFEAVSAPVTFRFYSWNAEASSGTFTLDNVDFRGMTGEVPEPGKGALLAVGMVLTVAWRRWKRTAPRRQGG